MKVSDITYLHARSHLSVIEEIQTLRSNLKQARQEHQTLEAQVRELRSTENATKVRKKFIFSKEYTLTTFYSSKSTPSINN